MRTYSYLNEAMRDIRFQFMSPTKSMLGAVVSRLQTRAATPVYAALLRQMDIQPDHNVLEIGFGRGVGIDMAVDRIVEGDGHVYGIEMSAYMHQYAISQLRDEIEQEKVTLLLKQVDILANILPLSSNFFDGAFHVDVFYAWNARYLQEMCSELFRLLRPGARIFCGMELARLRRLARYGVLRPSDFDPMRYVAALEANGFRDVQLNYERINADGNPWHDTDPAGAEIGDANESSSSKMSLIPIIRKWRWRRGGSSREILLISAQKPGELAAELEPSTVWAQLEAEVKEWRENANILQSESGRPIRITKKMENMRLGRDVEDQQQEQQEQKPEMLRDKKNPEREEEKSEDDAGKVKEKW